MAGCANAQDTFSKPFSRPPGWIVTGEGNGWDGQIQWCRAVGIFGRQELTILANSRTYGKLSFFTRQDMVAGVHTMVRAADPRTCATGKPSDEKAGILRFSTNQTEICDGRHDWRPLLDSDSPATLKVDGRVIAKGWMRGKIDPLMPQVTLTASSDFSNVGLKGQALSDARSIAIVPTDQRFPTLTLQASQFGAALKDLNRCLPTASKLF